jgi:hypothetical protein
MLTTLLARKKAAILERWYALILETYPTEVRKFLKGERDPFQNPVGQSIRDSIEAILDGLQRAQPLEAIAPALDRIIRIRAVQDFTPSQAVVFVFLLKRVLREEAWSELETQGGAAATREVEEQIDAMAGRCFDIYMECREKIFEIKTNEIKNRTYKLLERMNRRDGKTEQEGES